jgi:hypothetical protein
MANAASESEALVRLLHALEMPGRTHLAAATNAANATRFLASTNMANGAYTVANAGAMPTEGGYKLQVTHTVVAGSDTLGTITFVGVDLNGQPLTEVITPVSGSTALGTRIFKSVTSQTQAGWTAVSTADTITIGIQATCYLDDGPGTFGSLTINTTAAGTITITDANGTIAVLPSSATVGQYRYGMQYAGFLAVSQAAASDVTYAWNGD